MNDNVTNGISILRYYKGIKVNLNLIFYIICVSQYVFKCIFAVFINPRRSTILIKYFLKFGIPIDIQ